MEINLENVRQVVDMFLNDMKYQGVRFRDGTKEALITKSIWAGSDTNRLCDAIDSEFKKWVVPEGLVMPWGTIVPAKPKRSLIRKG